MDTLVPALAVLVALAVDRWLGEPPVRWHPVVWMGNYLGWAGRHVQAHTQQDLPAAQDLKAFWLGALAWIGGGALILIVFSGLQIGVVWLCDLCGWVVSGLLLGLLLKPLLAWALLKSEVLAVEHALSNPYSGSLESGRERLRYLVSRDVTTLSETQVRESAIETLAENLNDSVIAPLFWFALLGLPGAALFRFANTADAMWGYPGLYPNDSQGRNWAWAGKWAARADDVLAWVPARITALLLVAVTGAVQMKRLRAEATRSPSPNSGWPMAAMALALGVRLGKPGGYVLNGEAPAPQAQDTSRAIRYASNVLLAPVGIASIAIIFVVLRAAP
ncbi:cobalamin biosynthesis protein CobD [Rhodoferax sp. AJA081-3]|uniref:adenosylcobinamide-phosphate synthase CbiB n=1 Tax=Rhodoferax sp. AJA081-3 TaxID=2752316 RepID=UPI001ADF37FA|nr:adenosylcobinamide-phosphate synthase CbiB [Rhodoferax sp. AJA081-3]QTN29065.1 cobalamin biosynthesis protein CobD [Rhodoferax sp. AJA081-3]